ncbi:MAG: hypothetical protein U9R28_01855 [Pseudomonadota bacterium]|nr:hypothetical protein [Pseudomonadota bacterium]
MFKKWMLAFVLLGFTAVVQAEQKLNATVFMDQWDQPQSLTPDVQWLIFSTTKDGGSWVKTQLEEMGIENLQAKNWMYVADISQMPSLITKFMAIPKMKNYKFSIALEKEGEATVDWPKQEDAVNIYKLNALTIEEVHSLTSKESVATFLNSIK